MTQTISLKPPAAGTATKTTDPMVRVLRVAAEHGYVARGGEIDQATDTQLRALAKRGMLTLRVDLIGRRKVIAGGRITRVGLLALERAA